MDGRPVTGYEPGFDFELVRGQEGERFVHELLFTHGDKCEVKDDFKCLETGNVFVEYECCGRDGIWRKSGIAATDSDVYCVRIADTEFFLVSTTRALREVVKAAWRDPKNRVECKYGENPTKGVLLRWADLLSMIGEVPFFPNEQN